MLTLFSSQSNMSISAFIPLYSRPDRFFGHAIKFSVNHGFFQSPLIDDIFFIISSVNRSSARSSALGPSGLYLFPAMLKI